MKERGSVINPFERFEIDPRSGPAQITARFRELMEDARTEEAKAVLREAWEELTLHPRDRLRAALCTFPEAREQIPLGVDSEPPKAVPLAFHDLDLTDLLAPPTVLSALGPVAAPAEVETLMDDPVLLSVLGPRDGQKR